MLSILVPMLLTSTTSTSLSLIREILAIFVRLSLTSRMDNAYLSALKELLQPIVNVIVVLLMKFGTEPTVF